MKTEGKMLVGGLALALAVGLVVWRRSKEPRPVSLNGVTDRETLLLPEPGASQGRRVPKGIVVFLSQMIGDEWAFVTIPASISDVLFDEKRDFTGWIDRASLEPELVERK